MDTISKTKFKAHALEILRDVEQSDLLLVITDRGRPTIEIRKFRPREKSPLERLRGTVIRYDAPTVPVSEDDWENA